jgi:flagellar basal body-associated protein FliL
LEYENKEKMKSRRTIFLIIIVIFIILTALFLVIIVKNIIPKNNITSSELQEAKKQLNIHVLRYEKDLFSLNVNNLQKEIERLSHIYPPLLIEPNIWSDQLKLVGLKAYLQDTLILALYNAAEKVVKMDILEKELETAFGYYKVFYPNDSIPLIITLIPGLDISVPSVYIYDDILFVNIDMYLGAEFSYYETVGLPLYIIERCEPQYFPVDIFKKAMVYKHLGNVSCTTLLDAMIAEGKKLYFTEMMFPALHERFIIGYSDEKYNWANHYLGNAWSYLIEKNELFGKGEQLMRCYIEEAPFTKPFGNDSPGRMGAFIGWKLIQSYMTNHPEITLPELMKESDYQKIINTSKFKPQPK